MLYRKLGNTDIQVSNICFGSLSLGQIQGNISVNQGASVIKYALEQGINFIDTAEIYNTYPYIAEAIKGVSSEIVIATKSYAYSREMMKASFAKACKALNRDYIDIFLLHEQESALTLQGHWEAMAYLLELKKAGYVRAVGISTHHVAGVLAAAQTREIDVVHPLINYTGMGIVDGTRDQMEDAIDLAITSGKGIYAMKAIGGGNLLNNINTALTYAASLPVHSVAIGMKSCAEIDYNISYFKNGFVTEEIRTAVNLHKRHILIEDWCLSCGNCIDKCSQKALTLTDNGILVDNEKCLLCGYCAYACKDFCIKIV